MTHAHTLTIDLPTHEDAEALRDIVAGLGYQGTITMRSIERHDSPMRTTRLGQLMLGHMRHRPLLTHSWLELVEVAEKSDYSGASVSPTMRALATEGDVNKVAQGRWRLPE